MARVYQFHSISSEHCKTGKMSFVQIWNGGFAIKV
jgi:hypothetical protein